MGLKGPAHDQSFNDDMHKLDMFNCNKALSHYLNGITDSALHVLTRPLGMRAVAPPIPIRGGLVRRYQESVSRGKSTRALREKEIPKIRPFQDWFREARVLSCQSFLRPVYDLHGFINEYFTRDEILGFYLHGSISTLDHVPYYSDLDSLVIIRNIVIHDPKWLADFRERLLRSTTYLYLIDPFQHHGHFVLTEYDMTAYHELLFPTELFRYVTELSEFEAPLRFQIVKGTEGIRAAIQKRFYYYHEYWPGLMKKGRLTPYDLKHLIQDVLFLALLYVEARDQTFYYKREVFERHLLDKDLPENALSFLSVLSRVRQNFSMKSRFPFCFRRLLGFYGHPRGLHFLHKRFDQGPWGKILKQSNSFILLAQSFLRCIAEKIGLPGEL